MKSQFVCLFVCLSVCIKALKNLRCNDGDLFLFKNLDMFFYDFQFPASLAGKRYFLLKFKFELKATVMFYISLERCV